MTVVAATGSVDATRALGGALADLLRPGDVLVLAGDLGAGKTALTQGIARALGVEGQVTSPTFTLVHVYEDGRLPIHHLDVYRLEQLEEVADLGLPELLDEGGVVIVEWGDAILPALPADHLEIRLTFGDGDDDRTLTLTPGGTTWSARDRALHAALGPWLAGGGPGEEDR